MSIDFLSDKPVTIKQLVDAGARCGIVVTKNTLNKHIYTMTWDVDDYENYVTNVLTDPETQKAFRECIEPYGDRFVMERDFLLSKDGKFHYTSTKSDDLGIAHRLFNEIADVELISLDEYHQESFKEYEIKTRDEMEQHEVAAAIDAEHYDDTEDDSRDKDGFGGRWCLWTESAYPLERSAMTQDEVALSVEIDHEIGSEALKKLKSSNH